MIYPEVGFAFAHRNVASGAVVGRFHKN
jgi:hypothetical protein